MMGRRGMVPIADPSLFAGGYWRRPGQSPLDVLVLVLLALRHREVPRALAACAAS